MADVDDFVFKSSYGAIPGPKTFNAEISAYDRHFLRIALGATYVEKLAMTLSSEPVAAVLEVTCTDFSPTQVELFS